MTEACGSRDIGLSAGLPDTTLSTGSRDTTLSTGSRDTTLSTASCESLLAQLITLPEVVAGSGVLEALRLVTDIATIPTNDYLPFAFSAASRRENTPRVAFSDGVAGLSAWLKSP